MAMVPFRVSGAAADQSLEQRLFQIGPYTLHIKQNPKVDLLLARAYSLQLQDFPHMSNTGNLTRRLHVFKYVYCGTIDGLTQTKLLTPQQCSLSSCDVSFWRREVGHITTKGMMT